VAEYVGIGPESQIVFDYNDVQTFEESHQSKTFPAIWTVYKKQFVEGTWHDAEAWRMYFGTADEWTHTNSVKDTRNFRWMDSQQLDAVGMIYQCPRSRTYSTLVRAPMGISKSQLEEELQKYHVDTSNWGQPNTRSLMDLVDEMLDGFCTCTEIEGQFTRVVNLTPMM